MGSKNGFNPSLFFATVLKYLISNIKPNINNPSEFFAFYPTSINYIEKPFIRRDIRL